MELGILITGFINDVDECVFTEYSKKAVTLGKTYELISDCNGVVCFIDDDNEENYGIGTDSIYDHRIVVIWYVHDC